MEKENSIKEYIRISTVISGLMHDASDYGLDDIQAELEQDIIYKQGKPTLERLQAFIVNKENECLEQKRSFTYNGEDELDELVGEFNEENKKVKFQRHFEITEQLNRLQNDPEFLAQMKKIDNIKLPDDMPRR